MTVLCATDLDRTLIYSRAALGETGDRALIAVERYAGADASWVTQRAAAGLTALAGAALVVPVTTRTPAQWHRVRLPGPPPRFVVAAHGGILLRDGERDRSWDAAVRTQLRQAAALPEVWDHAGRVCRPEWSGALRNAAGLFCYALVHRERLPDGLVAEAAAWAAPRGWRVSLHGRKLYWLPTSLRKSAAVAEVATSAAAGVVLAAGDSVLDAELLRFADSGIAPRHGELVAAGWSAPHVAVTRARGALAGEEIVAWLAARAAVPLPTGAGG